MLRNKQALNWVTDAGLLAALLAEFYLDLTGVALHQWLGVALVALIGYHLAAHWSWAKAVAARFFQGTSAQARRYFLLDAGLALGFGLILASGLAISTWLDLPLSDYEFWKDLHVVSSVATLLIVVGKVGLHWKWVVKTAWSAFKAPGKAARPQPAPAGSTISRRHFLSLMGMVCLASLVAINEAVFEHASLPEETGASQPASDPTQPAASLSTGATQKATLAPTSTAQPTSPLTSSSSSSSSTGSCVVRCNRRCSYPGHCRRYTDQNGNNLCDLGECA